VFSRRKINRLVARANQAHNGETAIVAAGVAAENVVDGVDYHFHIKLNSKTKRPTNFEHFLLTFWIRFLF